MGTAAYERRWWAPRRWRAVLSRLLRGEEKHPFDRAHGVDTGGLIYADPPHDLHNAGYYATAPSLFRGAMDLWCGTIAATGYALEDYALMDIGCGKGRVLMLAMEYAFREIAGIELNPKLARVARKNLRRFGRRGWARFPHLKSEMWGTQLREHAEQGTRSVRVVEGDALGVALPDGPVALFYFNSFEREMMLKWLARLGEIAGERTAPLDLIYVHPEFDALVRRVPGMRALAEEEIPFTEEDAAADAFGVAEDRCAIYRHSGRR